MQTAARIGSEFSLDPVAVLAEEDPFLWALRIAAFNVIQKDRARK